VPTTGLVERTFREQRSRALATLVRLLGDFDLAEDDAPGGFPRRHRRVAA
jgi:predicted RNA polymerase sigma factor